MEKERNLLMNHIRIKKIHACMLLSQEQVLKHVGISQSSCNNLNQSRIRIRSETIPK